MMLQTQSYTELLEDLKSVITETGFASRWVLIEGYWLIGRRIREDSKEELATTKLLQKLAVDLGKSERSLWYCVKFFDKFEDLQLLKEGKNVRWQEIVTKYLSDGKPKEVKESTCECPKCHYVGKRQEFI